MSQTLQTQRVNAYEEGWKAYQEGRRLMDNPYPQRSIEWQDWRNGWHDSEPDDSKYERGQEW